MLHPSKLQCKHIMATYHPIVKGTTCCFKTPQQGLPKRGLLKKDLLIDTILVLHCLQPRKLYQCIKKISRSVTLHHIIIISFMVDKISSKRIASSNIATSLLDTAFMIIPHHHQQQQHYLPLALAQNLYLVKKVTFCGVSMTVLCSVILHTYT